MRQVFVLFLSELLIINKLYTYNAYFYVFVAKFIGIMRCTSAFTYYKNYYWCKLKRNISIFLLFWEQYYLRTYISVSTHWHSGSISGILSEHTKSRLTQFSWHSLYRFSSQDILGMIIMPMNKKRYQAIYSILKFSALNNNFIFLYISILTLSNMYNTGNEH